MVERERDMYMYLITWKTGQINKNEHFLMHINKSQRYTPNNKIYTCLKFVRREKEKRKEKR